MQLHILSADGSYHFFSPVRSCAFFGRVLTIKYANCSILGCHKATIVYSLSSYHTYNWPKFWNNPHALRLICPQAWILRSYAPLQLTDWALFVLFSFALLTAVHLVKPHLCSTELLTTTSKLGGIRGAAKQFLFLGTAVTKLQPLGQLTPPECLYQTRLTACLSEECMNWGRV